jgi:carbon storage regulator
MLVLSRQQDGKVVLDLSAAACAELAKQGSGCRAVLTVVELRGDKVRLGFSAPKVMTVHRLEVQEAVDRDIAREVALCQS